MRTVLFVTCLLVSGALNAARAEFTVETFPPRPLPGEAFSVVVGESVAATHLTVRFDGRDFPAWRQGPRWEALVAADRDTTPGTEEMIVVGRREPAGNPFRLTLPIVLGQRDDPEQRLRVDEKLVTLSAADKERAAREAAQIAATLDGRSPQRLWQGAFGIPVEGPVSSPFGVRRFYNGKPKSYHSGLDIAAPRGTPVRTPAEGLVALVGEFFYTGKTVFVDHGLGLFTAFFHLDSVSVREGQPLETGTALGRVGSTGRSTGAHLHWGVYVSGVKVDPLSLVRASGGAAGGGESP